VRHHALRRARTALLQVRFWPVSAGCWQILISPIPAVDEPRLPTRICHSRPSLDHPIGAKPD
jgi:hypothetical protein